MKNRNLRIFIVLLFLSAGQICAQSLYVKDLGFYGRVSSVVPTADGGFAFCGTSSADSGDFVVARYNSAGTRLWIREAGTVTAEYAQDITQTSDGGFVVTGKQGYWEFGMLVVKYDSSGNMLWSKRFQFGNFDRANGVCATTDGGTVIAGRSYDGLNVTAVAFKVSSSGSLVWGRSFSGFNDGGYSMIRSSDGKYVMTGSTGVGAAANTGIVKFDSSGVIWSRSVGGNEQEMTGMNHALVQTADGGYVICGTRYGTASDFYISKVSANGNLLWSNVFGTGLSEYANGIAVSGNNVFVAGYQESGSLPSVVQTPCLVKIDSAGNLNWSYKYFATTSAIPAAMTMLPNGNLIAGGNFTSGTANGKAAVSCFDVSGNGCQQKTQFGSSVLENISSPFAVSSGITSLPAVSVTLNQSAPGAESFICQCSSSSPLNITSQLSSICYGGSTVLSSSFEVGSYYTLYRNNVFVAATAGSSFTVTQGGNYFVVRQNGCGLDSSNVIHINVNTLPSASITASGRTKICVGQSVSLNASLSTGVTYQWLKNGGVIPGATSSTYVSSQTSTYSVRVTNTGTGCSKTGNSISVTVNPVPLIAITPYGPTSFCVGDSVVLDGSIGSIANAYQWRKNGTPISGATAPTFTAKQAGTYKVRVTDINGCTGLSPGVVVSVPCRIAQEPMVDIQVFPNPVAVEFSFVTTLEEPIQYRMSDDAGRVLRAGVWEQGDAGVFVGDLTSGIYMLQILTGGELHVQRLVVLR